MRFVNESGTFWPKANLAFNRHINSTPRNSVPLMRKKSLREHLARMSIHIFLHVLSTHSDTIEICNPGNVASDYRYIDSFHARIQKVLSEGVQLCNTDNIFLGERGSKYH